MTSTDEWIRGVWGVVRMRPWDLVGPFQTEAEARSRQQELGEDYQVTYGDWKRGSTDFIFPGKR